MGNVIKLILFYIFFVCLSEILRKWFPSSSHFCLLPLWCLFQPFSGTNRQTSMLKPIKKGTLVREKAGNLMLPSKFGGLKVILYSRRKVLNKMKKSVFRSIWLCFILLWKSRETGKFKISKSSDRTKKKLSDQKNDENFDCFGISIPDRGSFRGFY